VNDLRSFAALQARVYEFLAAQDETTLQAIASGEARLSILDAAGDAREAAAPVPREIPQPAPSDDPLQVARDLTGLGSEQDRRMYLNSTKLTVAKLRKVAKAFDLAHYSNLNRGELVDLLAGRGIDGTTQTDGLADERARSGPPPAETPTPSADAATIAIRLRETETEEDGAAYLQEQHLDRDGLLAVAAALGLTRVTRLSRSELEKRVLKQAIGARRKFAGLRQWCVVSRRTSTMPAGARCTCSVVAASGCRTCWRPGC
jgi:hypothetical protein